MEYIGYFISILIGVVLGLIGAGGSILALPVLVYIFKINPISATSYSLFIVGITAMFGAFNYYKLGFLKIKSALIFALPSLISVLLTRQFILPELPDTLFLISHFEVSKNIFLMIVFAVLMIAAAVSMIKKSTADTTTITVNYSKLALLGFLIGFITGFLGAGGGFLIIPALLFFAKLPIKQAIGTSLFIICINSLMGFAGDVLGGLIINYQLLFTISILAIIGTYIGTVIAKKIDGAKLKPAFGWFVLIMGIYIITNEFFLK
jgi:uncharacterized membrane protein YfcA